MSRVMVIPAAGAGSRLKLRAPKVLAPVNGRPMIDYLFDLYERWVDRFVLVLHPSAERAVREHCASRPRVGYAIQQAPTGMLDAILIARDELRAQRPASLWITWCDQIAVRAETVERLASLCDREPDAAVVFPTIMRSRPYIHLVRDERGEIVDILHEREGDSMPEVGESDMGLFALSWHAYRELLPRFAREVRAGAGTGERNFLPFLCWLRGRAKIRTFAGRDEIEAVGINTPEEMRMIEEHLRDE